MGMQHPVVALKGAWDRATPKMRRERCKEFGIPFNGRRTDWKAYRKLAPLYSARIDAMIEKMCSALEKGARMQNDLKRRALSGQRT